MALFQRMIAEEAIIIKRLEAEGWVAGQAGVFALRTLAKKAEELRSRYEAACSYQWATTDSYTKRTENLEAEVMASCELIGLHCYLQGDCRGATLYVSAKGPISDRSYNTEAWNIRPMERG
jgi:hypothetical protein